MQKTNKLKIEHIKFWLHKVKRGKPLDYLFFDWKVLTSVTLVFCVGLHFFYPGKVRIILPAKDSQVYILEAILRTISLFFGIIFPFVILSFNFFYRYFGRYAFLNFFQSNPAKTLISLLACDISLLIYSTAYIKELPKVNSFGNFIYILSISLTVICFLSIFPCLINLLRYSQNRNHIKKLFLKMDDDWIEEEERSRVLNEMQSFFQKDPVSIITEIGFSSIKDYDNRTVSSITANCSHYFIENSEKVKVGKSLVDNCTLYLRLTDMLINLLHYGLKERNDVVSSLIINCRIRLEQYVVENIENEEFKDFRRSDSIYMTKKLNWDIEDFFRKSIQFNEDDVCKNIIEKYTQFISKTIKNYLSTVLKIHTNSEVIDICEDFFFEPLRMFNKVYKMIGAAKQNHFVELIFAAYNSLEYTAIELDIREDAKCYILNVFFNFKHEIFDKYTDSSEKERIDLSHYPFKESANFYNLTNCHAPYYGSLQILDLLYAKNKLNTMVLNDHKAQLLLLIRIMKLKPGSKELILRAVHKFKQIVGLIKESDSDYKKAVYLTIHKYFNLIYQTAQLQTLPDQDILFALNETMQLFTLKKEFEVDLLNKGYIFDIRIV